MFVYIVTNKIKGTYYVGQHTGKYLSLYWRQCLKEASSSRKRDSKPLLYRAIRKYGPDNFSIRPLVIADTKDEIDLYEILLISVLGTKSPNGYNLTDGGDGTFGVKPSEETKKKISDANKGRVLSEETRARISAASKIRPFSKEFIEQQKRFSDFTTDDRRKYGKKGGGVSGNIVCCLRWNIRRGKPCTCGKHTEA